MSRFPPIAMNSILSRPNLFRYATKELSQDAFLAWLFSWLREESSPEDAPMREAAAALLRAFLMKSPTPPSLLDHLNDASVTEIRPQCCDADLWLVFNAPGMRPVCILIEDKTHTSFHSGQLKRASKKGAISAEERSADLVRIYFKTGWVRHDEREPPNEFQLFTRADALQTLAPHRLAHPVMIDFVDWLGELEDNEITCRAEVRVAERIADSFRHHAGLDEFLSQLFGKVIDEATEWYSSGTGRGGNPWMHFGFHTVDRTTAGHAEDECLFWRCDIRSGRPAISLRKYWKHSKSESDKDLARQRLDQLVTVTENVLTEHSKLAKLITPSRRSAQSSTYYEQELLVYVLGSGEDENHPKLITEHLPALHRILAEQLRALPA
jgi:hypothetical protein